MNSAVFVFVAERNTTVPAPRVEAAEVVCLGRDIGNFDFLYSTPNVAHIAIADIETDMAVFLAVLRVGIHVNGGTQWDAA